MEQFQVLDIKTVFESPLNPRRSFNEKKMEELVESIRAKGILMPLLVRPNDTAKIQQKVQTSAKKKKGK
jgi:ParB family chromosome partitioning protein